VDFAQKVDWFGEMFVFFAVNKAVPWSQHGNLPCIGEQGQFTMLILSLSP
jgi:hypothetical protein